MASRVNVIYATSKTQLKDKNVSLSLGSAANQLSVGDILFHKKSSEEDRAVMKAYLMKHPKSAVVDMFLNLIIHAHAPRTRKKG